MEKSLENCQIKICQYWNDTLYIHSQKSIRKINKWLLNTNFRCNTSDPNYKIFTSLKNCKKQLCRYAQISGKNLIEYSKSSNNLVTLWNRFYPKKKVKGFKFLQNCFKKICAHYKSQNQTWNFYPLCNSEELSHTMKNLYKLVKTWKEEQDKANEKKEGSEIESSLSISASAFGIVSAGVSIIASLVGCYVAKISISSISTAFPHISEGC